MVLPSVHKTKMTNMKKILILLCLLPVVLVQAITPLPNIGNGRIRVLGNNLENYYYNYNTGRGDYTEEQRTAKTLKIVNAMLASEADIFAFCEVEAKPIVLAQLADSMNAYCGVAGRYAAVSDGIDEDWDETYNNNLKSGFIYRTDKVQPYYSDYAATNVTYYKNVMRIQAWTELASGEHFTLSMNHFKAKTDEASVAKRVDNANWLISALSNSSKVKDEDILIMGDLNCQMGEEALTIIQNNGFVEQLLRFDENAYSYCYQGNTNLIDHVFANSTMAEQITGAAAWHVNTTCNGYGSNSSTHYSDHDPYLVALNLGGDLPPEHTCTAIDFSESFAESLGNFTPISVTGAATWYWYSNYTCANVNGYNKGANEDYLVSPVFDFTNQKSGTITFDHAVGYGTQADYPTQCQLLISDDYNGDVSAATWTPLTIANWSSTNFEWQTNTIDIPSAFMHKNNIYFAFYYTVGDSNAPAWEIKNLTVKTECEETTALPQIGAKPSARKELRNGQIVILRGDQIFTVTGQRVK